VESEIWEQVPLKTTEGVSVSWMGSSSSCPEPGGTAGGGMMGWVEEGIFLGPCPDKSMVSRTRAVSSFSLCVKLTFILANG